VRNLTLSELAECVSIDLGNPEESFDFDAVFTDAEDVVELCGRLITLSSDGHVALAHYTVKEFLVSGYIKDAMPQFWIGCDDVHAELASICLTYLTYDDFPGSDGTSGEALLQNFHEYKFLPYAVQAWGSHAHLGDINNINDTVFDLTMKLLDSGLEAGSNYNTCTRSISIYKKLLGSDSRLPTMILFILRPCLACLEPSQNCWEQVPTLTLKSR
jgi:hypothetical protein